MYTSEEYVIVVKVAISELNRFGSRWRTQMLHFRLIDSKKVIIVHVANAYDISNLKKGDKIKLNFHFMFQDVETVHVFL